MFRDLQQHNLQYQQLTDEINATQKRIMTIQDHIKQAKQTIQWQQCRLKSLVQQEATVSTSLFTETSPIDTINTLMEQVQRIQTRLCQRRVEYMTLCSGSMSHLTDIMTQQLSYCHQVLDDARANNPLYILSAPSQDGNDDETNGFGGLGLPPSIIDRDNDKNNNNNTNNDQNASHHTTTSTLLSEQLAASTSSFPLLSFQTPSMIKKSSSAARPTSIKMELDQLMSTNHNNSNHLELPNLLQNHKTTLTTTSINQSTSSTHNNKSLYDRTNNKYKENHNKSNAKKNTTNNTKPPPDNHLTTLLNLLDIITKPPTAAQIQVFRHLNISQLQFLYDKLYKSLQCILLPVKVSIPEIITNYHLRINQLSDQLEAKQRQIAEEEEEKEKKMYNKRNYPVVMKQLEVEEKDLDQQIELYERKIRATQCGIDVKNRYLAELFGTEVPVPLYHNPDGMTKRQKTGKNGVINDVNNNNSDINARIATKLPGDDEFDPFSDDFQPFMLDLDHNDDEKTPMNNKSTEKQTRIAKTKGLFRKGGIVQGAAPPVPSMIPSTKKR